MQAPVRKLLFMLIALAVGWGMGALLFPLQEIKGSVVRALGIAAALTLFVGIMRLLHSRPENPWYSDRTVSWKVLPLCFVFVFAVFVVLGGNSRVAINLMIIMLAGILVAIAAYRARSGILREKISQKDVWLQTGAILLLAVTIVTTTFVHSRVLTYSLFFLCVFLVLLWAMAETSQKKS